MQPSPDSAELSLCDDRARMEVLSAPAVDDSRRKRMHSRFSAYDIYHASASCAPSQPIRFASVRSARRMHACMPRARRTCAHSRRAEDTPNSAFFARRVVRAVDAPKSSRWVPCGSSQWFCLLLTQSRVAWFRSRWHSLRCAGSEEFCMLARRRWASTKHVARWTHSIACE